MDVVFVRDHIESHVVPGQLLKLSQVNVVSEIVSPQRECGLLSVRIELSEQFLELFLPLEDISFLAVVAISCLTV